ncbi:Fic/DOC family protein [Conyzicola sp.]|uniref:Fic/DOC family protein n=1 Tax=Conyzicola sp. TaxID=1969404 RepID=UPI0039890BA6
MASNDLSLPDPYSENGVLRNLVGATTPQALRIAEGSLSLLRLSSLVESWPSPTGDLDEWKAIHQTLFQDVYDWAGTLRTMGIAKQVPNANKFADHRLIERNAWNQANSLREEGNLKGLGKHEFVRKLADQYDAFNYLHPFRDGNGRVQRLFWDRIAREAGWSVDWTLVGGETVGRLSREAGNSGDLSHLVEMFSAITSKAPAPMAPAERAAWLRRVAFGTHDDASPAARALVKPTYILTSGSMCGFPMPRARTGCVLLVDHGGHHRSKVPTKLSETTTRAL